MKQTFQKGSNTHSTTLQSEVCPNSKPRTREFQTHEKKENSDFSELVNEVVAKAGIEPATHGFSVRCSTN